MGLGRTFRKLERFLDEIDEWRERIERLLEKLELVYELLRDDDDDDDDDDQVDEDVSVSST